MVIPCLGGRLVSGSATNSKPADRPVTAIPGAPPELADLSLERTDHYVRLILPGWWRTCGWSPLGGGLTRARNMFILRVHEDGSRAPSEYPPPETTLDRYCREHHWSSPTIGMMTAASMDSCRWAWRNEAGVAVGVILTAGLANARRAGDRADYQEKNDHALPAGTINILAATNAKLTDAALLEALMIMTEAKAAVLSEYGIKSAVSGLVATGTGTDCATLACGEGPPLRWCGKHVLFGEMLGRAVMEALSSSIAWEVNR
nr:adenosylcobinamide amidohydrolase [Solidesulfovibrio fructosivorans]